MPNFSAARAARISPSACCMPVSPVGAIATGITVSTPTIFVRSVRLSMSTATRWRSLMPLEVVFVRAVGALGPRAGIGVVVEHARHAPLRQHAQVFDVGDDGHGNPVRRSAEDATTPPVAGACRQGSVGERATCAQRSRHGIEERQAGVVVRVDRGLEPVGSTSGAAGSGATSSSKRRQATGAHAEQPQAPRQVDALQAGAGGPANVARVQRVRRQASGRASPT